jgi:hypothetical protein
MPRQVTLQQLPLLVPLYCAAAAAATADSTELRMLLHVPCRCQRAQAQIPESSTQLLL